jgi:hypothetical protein
MRSYEIQLFKGENGGIGSYFDDRDSAMSDADQLAADLRIQGVRILKEKYVQESNVASCDVKFIRKRINSGPGDRRKGTQQMVRSNPRPTGTLKSPRRSARRRGGLRAELAQANVVLARKNQALRCPW